MSGLASMNPFWREQPLDNAERALLAALFEAHYNSAFRDNVSSHAVLGAAIGAGQYENAIAAALLTLGSLHGPIAQAMEFLSRKHPDSDVPKIIKTGKKAPGWGSSFAKEKPDPLWKDVHQMLVESWPELGVRVNAVTEAFAKSGKPIHPNPACYTACVAMILRIPATCASFLFLAGRLNAWSRMFMKHETSNQIWEG